MKLIRYELTNNVDSIGLLAGIWRTEIDMVIITKILSHFQEELYCPIIEEEKAIFYFTEEGNDKFKEQIETIKESLDYFQCSWKLIKKELNFTNEEVVYEDEYQMALIIN